MHAEERSEADLIGRSHELEIVARAFDRSRKDGVPTVIQIEGDAGIGKSSLLQAAQTQAVRRGWTVAAATCYAVQSQIPLSMARQLLRSLLEAIGDERARYATGLESLLESAKPETGAQAFTRLLEGVTLDRRVAIAVDDIQWADRDSIQLIDETLATLADRAILVLVAKRPQSESALAGTEINVLLQPLDETAGKAVARHLLPDAGDEIVAAIVSHSRGYPLDIVALSKAISRVECPSVADVASSRRSAIARDVQTASPELREFLQICSLVDGPTGYRLLERLWPNQGKLDALVRDAVGRFFRETELGVEFDHALIAEGVRHTIAVSVPYRRRIVTALESLQSPTLEDLQTLASQLVECGDRAGAFNVLADVARKAAASGQTRVTASVSERALGYSEPPADVARTFFPDYADALFALDRDTEAIAVLERALRVFDGVGTGIPGSAVARLMLAQCFSDRLSAAETTYARFLPTMKDDSDRAHVISAAIWFAACRADLALADSLEKELLQLDCDLPFAAKIRMRNFRAYVLAQHGRHQEAMALLDEAAAIVDEAALLGHIGISTNQRNVPRVLLSLFEYGGRVIEPLLEERQRATGDFERNPADEYLRCLTAFLRGGWELAETKIAETVDIARPTGRRRFLSIAAAIAALRQGDSPYRKAIETDVSAFLLGRREGWYDPLAAWWAAATAESEPTTARKVLSHFLSQLEKPSDPHIYMPKVALVLLAHRLRDGASLSALASKPGWNPQTPWHNLHDSIARGIAAGLLGKSPGNDLSSAMPHARELGLNVYADLAAATLSKSDAAATSRLSALGIKWLGTAVTPVKDSFLKPTARELQVASLVADGKSNQQIADALVLSQRTVEVHISNLFNKIGATSRTQLATWFVRRDATG